MRVDGWEAWKVDSSAKLLGGERLVVQKAVNWADAKASVTVEQKDCW